MDAKSPQSSATASQLFICRWFLPEACPRKSQTSAAAAHYGLTATIVVPHGNSREKNRALQSLGATLIEHGDDFQSAFEHASELAETLDLHFIPSFHPLLVHGTGTFALEMLTTAPPLAIVYVPIGMGSSVTGTLAARAALSLSTKIIGVVASASPAYALSFRAKTVIPHPAETHIADGLACRLPNADALEVIVNGVDHIVEVTDTEIGTAMRFLYEDTHNVAEGAGATALAGLLHERDQNQGKRIGIILTGGNVDREMFLEALQSA
jgi:threonine dehydratase